MLIRFGMHLDGLQPLQSGTGIGEVTRGPLGLLDLLEVQLGLPPVIATSADTLMAYRACLAETDAASRFFHASFTLDPINVSRTLLEWRATLYEFGWDGGFPSDAPTRLRDMSDVETLASMRVPLCRGQRVRRVVAALDELATQIERVELLDDIGELPPVWRTLLQKLGVRRATRDRSRAARAGRFRSAHVAGRAIATRQDGRRSRGREARLARRRFVRGVARCVARHHRTGRRRGHRAQRSARRLRWSSPNTTASFSTTRSSASACRARASSTIRASARSRRY